MPTMSKRARLHRQEFLDTDTAVYATQPGPLTAAELRDHWPNCSGPCDQGRKLCPCPDECQIPDDDSLAVFVGARNALLMMAAIALCIGFVVWVLR